MKCKHSNGVDWSTAKLDRRNGGWRVKCVDCGEELLFRREISPEAMRRRTAKNGPKEHMSKKQRLRERRYYEHVSESMAGIGSDGEPV